MYYLFMRGLFEEGNKKKGINNKTLTDESAGESCLFVDLGEVGYGAEEERLLEVETQELALGTPDVRAFPIHPHLTLLPPPRIHT